MTRAEGRKPGRSAPGRRQEQQGARGGGTLDESFTRDCQDPEGGCRFFTSRVVEADHPLSFATKNGPARVCYC